MNKLTRFRDIPLYIQHGSYEIDVPMDRMVVNVNELVEQGLQLDPDFQRGHVWSGSQQKAFIEFILRGGKTARVLYFNFPSWHWPVKTKYNEFVIVDGKQRFEAVRRFIGNEIKVFGSYYREFTDSIRLMGLRININALQSKAEVLRWYIDFNSGGVVHSDKEIARVQRLLKKELK